MVEERAGRRGSEFRQPLPHERGPLVEAARKLLEGLIPEERMRAIAAFCKSCGRHVGEQGSCCCDRKE